MARYETLTCDRCGTEETVPAKNWVTTAPTKGSVMHADREAKGDFCSVSCAVQFLGALVIQQHLFNVADAASDALERLSDAAPDEGDD